MAIGRGVDGPIGARPALGNEKQRPFRGLWTVLARSLFSQTRRSGIGRWPCQHATASPYLAAEISFVSGHKKPERSALLFLFLQCQVLVLIWPLFSFHDLAQFNPLHCVELH